MSSILRAADPLPGLRFFLQAQRILCSQRLLPISLFLTRDGKIVWSKGNLYLLNLITSRCSLLHPTQRFFMVYQRPRQGRLSLATGLHTGRCSHAACFGVPGFIGSLALPFPYPPSRYRESLRLPWRPSVPASLLALPRAGLSHWALWSPLLSSAPRGFSSCPPPGEKPLFYVTLRFSQTFWLYPSPPHFTQ